MAFDDDERSTSQNRPIDLYTIVAGLDTYRLTSHVIDVSALGFTFTATTTSRGKLSVESDSSQDEIIVYLPISHPLVRRFCSSGIPGQSVRVTVMRQQSVSGLVVQQATGFAQSMSIDGHTALLRVPSMTSDAFKTQLPTVQATRICAHVLFDGQCSPVPGGLWPASGPSGSGGPDRSAFTFAVGVSSVSADGRTYTVDTIAGKPNGWAKFGRLIDTTSPTESRLILDQVGTTITIKSPFFSSRSVVTIETGCDHTFSTCVAKFNNKYNFGGYPAMNSNPNPWAPAGLGIVIQT